MGRGDANLTGVVAALRAEALCIAPSRGARSPTEDLLVRVSGIGCERAADSAAQLLRAGATALLCFGVGGALAPGLRCGDVVLASEVLAEAQGPGCERVRAATDTSWRRQLEVRLGQVGSLQVGAVLTSNVLIARPEQRQRLFAATSALVVDMESAAVAQVAKQHAVPFLALRVVADTASDVLPDSLQRALGGHANASMTGAFWWSLLRAPGGWPALVQLGRRYRRARTVLSRCAQAGLAYGATAALKA